MIRRRGVVEEGSSSSSDEEDAFSAMARKTSTKDKKNKKQKINNKNNNESKSSTTTATTTRPEPKPTAASAQTPKPVPIPTPAPSTQQRKPRSRSHDGNQTQQPPAVAAVTSSMKRHHGAMSDARKRKMDELIKELQQEPGRNAQADRRSPYVPDKKGSFVKPGEEQVTTNIFVGNLPPTLTEEDVTELFRQFGEDLGSSRTVPERERVSDTETNRLMTEHVGILPLQRLLWPVSPTAA